MVLREKLLTLPGPTGGTPNPPCAPEITTDPSRPSGRGTLPLPALREGYFTSPGPPNQSQLFGWAFRPLPTLWKGLATTPGPCQGLPTPPSPFARASKTPAIRMKLPTPPDYPGGPSNTARPSGRASRPLPVLWVGLQTSRSSPEWPTDLSWPSRPLLALQDSLPALPGPHWGTLDPPPPEKVS